MSRRSHVQDLRGASRLAVEATRSITDLVEAMHVTIAGGPAVLGTPLALPVRLVTGPVYGSIRAVTKLVGVTLDAALARLVPLLGTSSAGPEREAVLAVINGVLGDYLSATNNPLATEMRLHTSEPRGTRLLVMVHGSSMGHLQWTRFGENYAESIARELGYAAVYLHYNSGLHISTNGSAFADMLEQLVSTWPDRIEEIVLVGHSMGGLVSRSACHAAEQNNHAWRTKLTRLVTIGTPHHGAPLERGGNLFEVLLGVSRYSAPLARLGKIRSAGVTDLRWGNVLDEHWQDRDRFELTADLRNPLPLPIGVDTLAIAGTAARAPGDDLPGDGLVPVDSALGRHDRTEHCLSFSRSFIAYETLHIALLSSPQVFDEIRSWLA